MREILFRGKTEQFGNWIKGSLIVGRDLESGQLEYLIAPLSAYYTEVKKVIPETVGQYTGLTDKNGTKIFEGDIVKNEIGIKTTVEFYNGRYYPFIAFPEHRCWECDECEVIGNIHENPELLGGE